MTGHQQVDRHIWVVVGKQLEDTGLAKIEGSDAGRKFRL